MAQFLFSRRISHIVHGICEPGDVKPLDDDVAARYVKHGWGTIVEPPKPKTTPRRKPKAGD